MIATEVFMDILSLHRQGLTMRAIARKLVIHRNTVKKYLTEPDKFPTVLFDFTTLTSKLSSSCFEEYNLIEES